MVRPLHLATNIEGLNKMANLSKELKFKTAKQ